MERQKYLKLEKQGSHDWAFNRPPEWEFFDRRLDTVVGAERDGDIEKAIQICLQLTESCPEYLPAINKLGLLFRDKGDLDEAIAIFEGAVGVGLACMPEEFKQTEDLIPWYWVDNRDFLLAYEHLGVCYLQKALVAFEHLHEMNPGYHGVANLITNLRTVLGTEEDRVGSADEQ